MKHLDNLTIHRFRGLRDLALQELGQINLLVGANNSGKTSVLEAISTYCRPLDPLEWLNTLEFDNILRGAELELKVTTTFSPEELSVSFEIWENQRFINRKNRSTAVLPIDTVTPFSHRIEQLQVSLLSEAILLGIKPEVIKLLQLMDSEITDLVILSPTGKRPSLYIDHKRVGISPLSAFGDGVRRLLFIALTLAKVQGGVLLIDEIETAIHTVALGSSFAWIVQWCQRFDVQLFATTHSLETVDAMLDASDPDTDLVLYRLEKQESQTKAIRLDRETLHIVRDELGQEVRR